jgi:heme oxygenase
MRKSRSARREPAPGAKGTKFGVVQLEAVAPAGRRPRTPRPRPLTCADRWGRRSERRLPRNVPELNCPRPRDIKQFINAGSHMRVHMLIKRSIAAGHTKVDELFSAFDLAKRRSYVGFLRANARALLPLEQLLFDDFKLPWWAPRGPLLLNDLEVLRSFGDLKFPPRMCSEMSNHGSRFGVLYVLEGSRFGAAVLKGRVASGLPREFLSAEAKPGYWPSFLNALECAAAERSPIWLDNVAMGASIAFDLFAASAIAELQLLEQPARTVEIR